mgnify:CR=1 FL=1
MAKKWVYLFKEGNANMRELLGGKGANLAEMTNIGLPVPQGFTITTEACTQYYEDGRQINNEIMAEIMTYITKMEETFEPNSTFNPDIYFKDSFGAWVNKETYPVKDVTIAVTSNVASYLRTLPLHHSQKELPNPHADGRILFSFHISLTPDFMGELNRWGEDLEIVNVK